MWNNQHQLERSIDCCGKKNKFCCNLLRKKRLTMYLKKSSGLLSMLLISTFISNGLANYEFNQGGSKIITSSFGTNRYFDDCLDFSGRKVKHGFHFVPPKVEMCKMCVCENGHPKNCRPIICAPPFGCRTFTMGSSCCEYICLDDVEAEKAEQSKKRVLIFCLLLLILLVILLCLAYRFKRRLREEFDKMVLLIEEKRKKRNQTKSETVSSELTLKEDIRETTDMNEVIPAKKPVYMISQNEVINELKKRIDSMEFKLDVDEPFDEPVQNGCDDSWKNCCDLQVELKDSAT